MIFNSTWPFRCSSQNLRRFRTDAVDRGVCPVMYRCNEYFVGALARLAARLGFALAFRLFTGQPPAAAFAPFAFLFTAFLPRRSRPTSTLSTFERSPMILRI